MLFAVERYDDSGVGEHPDFPALPAGVRLAAAIHLPADEVVLALVDGPDESAVGAAVVAAGWRIDRISPAQWLLPSTSAEVLA